ATVASSTPTVTTNAATAQTDTTATLNATVGSTTADNTSFWWGPSTAGPFTSGTNPASTQLPSGWSNDSGLGAVGANGMFSENISNLTPNTTYSFVAWIQSNGTWYPGAVTTFTTNMSSTTSTTTPDITTLQNEITILQNQVATL